MTKQIFTFRNFVNLSKIIIAHTRNRPLLEVNEGKSVMDRYWSPKPHASKIENTLNYTVCVTFPKVFRNLNQEALR